MRNLSCHQLAQQILECCLDGRDWPLQALDQIIQCALSADPARAEEGNCALFKTLAEGLADRFEPRLADIYGEIFAQVIAAAEPGLSPRELVERYRQVRRTIPFNQRRRPVQRVFVLSRVTLGADIAVTSVLLDAAKRRFADAEIILAGSQASRQLFGRDPRIGFCEITYERGGSLRERLAVGRKLAELLADPESIVIDPDSRLTQLGLFPVATPDRYYFFDSRSYGGESGDPLPVLAARWAAEVFGVIGAAPFVAPAPETAYAQLDGAIVVNLGVGENAAKRVPDPFERELVAFLAKLGLPVLLDVGAAPEEQARVRRAAEAATNSSGNVRLWRGSFAALVANIARCRLYVGYDSAGQHAAAACGAPMVTVFAGFVSERMLARWSPWGPGPKEIIRVDKPDPEPVLARTRAAVEKLIQDPVG